MTRNQARHADRGEAGKPTLSETLDDLLRPLDDLRRERFQSELESDADDPSPAAPALVLPRQRSGERLARLGGRIRHSRRRPYRLVRGVLVWCAMAAAVFAVTWLLVGHSG